MYISDFKLNLSTFWKTLSLILACCGLYYSFGFLPNFQTRDFYYTRFEEVAGYASSIEPNSESSIVAIGASDIAMNFSPIQIKEFLAKSGNSAPPKISLYNFGVIMGGPDLTSIISSEFTKNPHLGAKKLKLAILGFRPMMFTRNYRKFMYWIGVNFKKGVAASATWNEILKRPHYFLDMALRRSFPFLNKGGAGVQDVRGMIGSDFFCSECGIDYKKISAKFWNLISTDFIAEPLQNSQYGEIDIFHPRFQGFYTQYINENESDLYLGIWESHLALYNHVSNDFSCFSFREFEDSIENMKSVAEKVMIIYTPDFIRSDFGPLPENSRTRLKEVLNKFSNRKDIEFVDLSNDLQFENADFVDMVHLTASGKRKWNFALSKYIERSLKTIQP